MPRKTKPDELLKPDDATRADAEAVRAEAELARAEAEAARAAAEAANLRFSFLAEASRVLGGSLDYETTLQNVARLIVPQLGDFCVVDLAEEGERIRRVAVADVDAKREELVWRIAREHPLSVHSPPSYSKVLSTGRSEWLPEVTDEMCLALPEDADPEVMHSLKFRSFICVPLPVHGQILGTISIARSTPGRSYTAVDLALAEELARRAGLAVDHARLYRASEEANRLKDEFLATLSHELRSPLSSALLCAQMLRRGILDAEKSARALETIERKISLEVRLVDDLVDISRITSGKIALEMERVELAAVVHSAIEGVRPAAEAQDIRLGFTPHELETPIRGDEGRLQQVMANLLSNAIKFTPKGGSIDVTLERVGREARIAVRDTGLGISAETLPRVFERFRQHDTSLTRKFGGLGLGLAIVRNLVELHGGRVSAESAGEGHGATFTVAFPLLPVGTWVAPPPIAGGRYRSVELEDLSGVRVLVVDDEEDARTSMATLLATCGAAVTTAGSTSEALAILEPGEKPQDVLVSDISMPDVDGYTLLRALRARSPGGAAIVPAIAVTAYAGPRDRELALAAGYRSYLSKPVDERDLVAAVAELAGRRPPPPTAAALISGEMKEAEATVFVVDDDPDLRESLGWLLEAAGLRVRSYSTAQEFLNDYDPEAPGCLLIDVRMPGGLSGLDLQEDLRRRGVPPPIIIMTGYARVPMAIRALKGGALDFIQKPFREESLLERIRQAIELDRRTRQERVKCTRFAALLANLTPREREVMTLVIAGKPNKIIAADLGISPKTVEIHRGRVMEKLQVDSVAELVRLDLLHRANRAEDADSE